MLDNSHKISIHIFSAKKSNCCLLQLQRYFKKPATAITIIILKVKEKKTLTCCSWWVEYIRVAKAAKIWPCCIISPTQDKSLPQTLTALDTLAWYIRWWSEKMVKLKTNHKNFFYQKQWQLWQCIFLLNLVLLNKLRCHTHFYFSANQITWSRLIQIHKVNDKQWRSR